MHRRQLIAATVALGLAASLPAVAANSPHAGAPAGALDHQQFVAMLEELAPGIDIEALGDEIRQVVRDNAPAGADVETLQNQVFEMFHQAMAEAANSPQGKDHLRQMLSMVRAAKTDPAAREHVRVMLATHAGG